MFLIIQAALTRAEILIVDKKSDLNIYKERNQGGGESSCCATVEDKSASSCCAPAASCCSTSTSAEKMGSEKEDLAKRVANIDFNEWVSKSSPIPNITLHAVIRILGSFSIYAVKPTSSV